MNLTLTGGRVGSFVGTVAATSPDGRCGGNVRLVSVDDDDTIDVEDVITYGPCMGSRTHVQRVSSGTLRARSTFLGITGTGTLGRQ